jgi:hypothetical protein
MFKTPEYQHLLDAERAISEALEPKPSDSGEVTYPEARDVAQLATALVRVIDQKRIMRGQPAPKPAEAKPRKVKTEDHDTGPLEP